MNASVGMAGARVSSPARTDSDVDDELDQVFPGCSFTHLLIVVSRDQLSITIGVLTAISRLGGSLDSLRLNRIGGKLEHRFRITGLRPSQARLLANQLAGTARIERASVEHQILKVAPFQGRA